MAFLKRISLFLLVNFLVVFTVSIVLRVFNVTPFLTRYGMDYYSLLLFCLVWGMLGSIISLFLSKQMAKWMLGVQVIQKGQSPTSDELINMVEELSRKAGLQQCPEVGIFSHRSSNAFATGATKNSSLVAVSDGLLNKMDKDQLRAILGHEISHITSGDMVTMALLQGIVNAFVMFLARIFAFIFSGLGNSNRNQNSGSYFGYFMSVMLFEFVFMLLGSMVVCAFSRFREFKADKGGALLSSKSSMISALQALKSEHSPEMKKQQSIAALMINTKANQGFLRLFATHPPLEERIKRLSSY